MTARPRTRARSARITLIAATVVGVGLLGGFGLLAVTAQKGLPLAHHYDVEVRFADAKGIAPYSEVRMAGKLVGQVLGSSYSDSAARVRLRLNGSVTPLRSDTHARIRLKGLVGAKFVDLVPGTTGRPLASGATIPATQTSSTVDVFDVISALDAPRRAALRKTIAGLGAGFAGRGGDLNLAIAQTPGVMRGYGDAAAAVNARRGAAERFVPATASLVSAFDDARGELAAGFRSAASALEPFATEAHDVDRTLAVAPSALATLRRGLSQTDPLLAETIGFARDAQRLTRIAPAALRNTTALLRSAPQPLRDTRALLRDLRVAMAPTVRLVRGLRPLAGPTADLLNRALPLLNGLGSRACDFERMVRNWRSLLSLGTPPVSDIGPSAVIRTGVALNTPSLVAGAPLSTTHVGHDAYPAPCTASSRRW